MSNTEFKERKSQNFRRYYEESGESNDQPKEKRLSNKFDSNKIRIKFDGNSFEDDKFDKKSNDKFQDNRSNKKFKDKRNGKDQIESKVLAKLKKARIIIRNIPFGIEEHQLSNEFIKFGDIHEVIIPRTDEGRQKGFAFINFKQTVSAIKAVKEMNGKQLSSRKFTRMIAVDFAMSKNQYINHVYSLKKIDLLNEENKESANKAIEQKCDKVEKNEFNESSSEDSDDQSDQELDNENDDEIPEEQKEDESKESDKNQKKRTSKFIDDENVQQSKKLKKQSNDVEDGKTVFIRNLSFESNLEDLTELMKQFGELEYCIICMDKITEHSKGTAFAKFKNKEDADQCVEKSMNKDENEEMFYLDGRVLDVQLAVTKNQLNVKKLENEKQRDKRNLYLSKEGLIYPDSPAAEGVSAEDLKKRLSLSQSKKKQLENLHYFVSKNRLCFHNLPYSYKDDDLRKLCMNVLKGEPDVRILFCKIMKNKDKTTNQFSTSKGFGFVSFATHRHALRVLRALNNNPAIFTNERRPIVEFSVENLNALMKNKQFIIKESLELGLEDEFVAHNWAGFQSKPFGTQEKIINPLTSKRIKDKKKKLQERVREQKVSKREQNSNSLRKESIKLKRKRIQENKPLKKKKLQEDPSINQEMKFLNKLTNQKAKESSKQSNSKSKLMKKKKWNS